MAKGKPGPELMKEIDEIFQKIGTYWDNELCAEHDGTIASFERLKLKLSDISNYEMLFTRDQKNLMKYAKVGGGVVVGVIVVGTTIISGGSSAPAFAGLLGKIGLLGAAGTGTAISILPGAVLTGASLAAIGGAVTGGILVIAAAGASLGGVLGGVVANCYVRQVKDFKIIKLKRGHEEGGNLIFINGFLQQKERLFEDWQKSYKQRMPPKNMTGVTWESKTLVKLGTTFAELGGKAASTLLMRIARKGTKGAGKKLGPVAIALAFFDLAKNPWHVSMAKAAQAGSMVADAIARCEGQKFTLVGHSLGCRVIYYALENLSTKEGTYIQDIVFLGGAIGRTNDKEWARVTDAVSGNIYNCFTDNDMILKRLYKTANAFVSDPIGLGPITCNAPNVFNFDMSDLITGHMRWKEELDSVLERITD